METEIMARRNRSGWRRTSAALVLLGVGLLACDDDPAPPFEITGSGSVEGIVFLDANDDGIFDPSAGDEPVSGVQIQARERGTQNVIAGGETVTGQDGRFVLEGLPPGTHDIFFIEESVPEGVSLCQNPMQASVYRQETTFRSVAGKLACLVSIVEAEEQALGTFVIVRGTVTSAPGEIRSGYTHIQDEEGGIRLFDTGLQGQGIEIGDLIEVGGTLAEFGGDLQLTGLTLREHIEDFEEVEPEETTTAAIDAVADNPRAPLGGRLVVVRAARLVTGFATGGSRNAQINDGSGLALVRVESGVSADNGAAILQAGGLTVGNCYDIVGVVGLFGSDGQLFPRSFADFTEVPCAG